MAWTSPYSICPHRRFALARQYAISQKRALHFPTALQIVFRHLCSLDPPSTTEVPGGDMKVGFSTLLNDKKSTLEKTRSIQLGIEYRLQHRLAFRLGYKDGHFTAGTGLQLRRFGVDLAFMEHDQLDNTYRISAILFF